MPELQKILEQRKSKPFIKRSYRSWNLTGGSSDLTHSELDNDLAELESGVKGNELDNKASSEAAVTPEGNQVFRRDASNAALVPKGNELGNNSLTESEDFPDEKPTFRRDALGAMSIVKGNELDNRSALEVEGALKGKQPFRRDRLKTVSVLKGNELDSDLFSSKDKIALSIKQLKGIQRKILLYVVKTCGKDGVIQAVEVFTPDLANNIGCSYGSVKTSLKRLIDKSLIARGKGRRSRAGFVVLIVPKDVYIYCVATYKNPILNSNLDNKLLDNNTASTTSHVDGEAFNKLPAEWQKINVAPLEEVGLTKRHLADIFSTNSIDPQSVQESIYHFAWGLEHNKEKYKHYTNSLNVFIGRLRKGGAWTESKYESTQEIALKKLKEQKLKQKQNVEKTLDEMVVIDFPLWKNTLSKEMTAKLSLGTAGSTAESLLKHHYKTKVLLPKLKADPSFASLFEDFD